MNKQEKIDKIYKVIANKEEIYEYFCPKCGEEIELNKRDLYECYDCEWQYEEKDVINELIGVENDPVMIGDVLDWIEEVPEEENGAIGYILSLWKYKRESIEEQSDECIDYIYNLIN